MILLVVHHSVLRAKLQAALLGSSKVKIVAPLASFAGQRFTAAYVVGKPRMHEAQSASWSTEYDSWLDNVVKTKLPHGVNLEFLP